MKKKMYEMLANWSISGEIALVGPKHEQLSAVLMAEQITVLDRIATALERVVDEQPTTTDTHR